MAAPKPGSKTRSKWERIIAAGEVSGLTAAEYCRKNGISPKYYSLWKGKLAGGGTSAQEGGRKAPKGRKTATAKGTQRSTSLPSEADGERTAVEASPREAYLLTATLPNGLQIEIRCRGEAELSLALKHLSSL